MRSLSFEAFCGGAETSPRIETIPDQVAESVADINNRREVLIWPPDSQSVSHFFVWRNGELTPLKPLPGFEGN